jgi:predicted ATPase/DNA-binding SARP family transcriptional activator
MARLVIFALGTLQVTLDGQPVTEFESNKVRALMAYLAVESDRPHSRDALMALLWPDQPDRTARNNLRHVLPILRQAIGDATAQPPFLSITRDYIQFNADSDCWLDVTVFNALLSACERHAHRRAEICKSCMQRLQQAVEHYRGDFLRQFFLSDSPTFEEWAVLKRERLRRQALDALYRLAGFYEGRGDHKLALQYASRQLELDPWREEAHRQAMRALALGGERSAALAQYETCRRTLARELGVEPARETVALHEQIKSGTLEAGPSTLNLQLSHLPAPATSFIGREKELAEMAELLENPRCRLVTVIGPGGIGKTRLAVAAAAEQIGAFAHGVCFVSLAPLNSAELIVPTLADALGFAFTGPQDPKAQLLNYLRERQVLLVLDNLEHLQDGPPLIAEILQAAPHVTCLVTSRERLNLQAEWVVDVQGLPFPLSERVERLEGYSAIELFHARARQVQPSFQLGDQVSAVARICRLVEGLPLAIELAASWVRVLACTQIADEIAHDITFLTTTTRDMPMRHRSMMAVLDHSWRLLDQHERNTLAALSVFRGGFRREAAEAVTGASLAVLSSLEAKSLVRRTQLGRYDLHELVRQYAAEKLLDDADDAAAVHSRHSAHYLLLLQEQGHRLNSAQQDAALAMLATEMENVRAAWQWAVGRQHWSEIQQSALSLMWLYEAQSRHAEGQRLFEEAVQQLDAESVDGMSLNLERTSALGRVLTGHGVFLWRLGHNDRAQRSLQRGLTWLRQANDRSAMAANLIFFGVLALSQGEPDTAQNRLEESAYLSEELGDLAGQAMAVLQLSVVSRVRGDYATARSRAERAVAWYRQIGNREMAAIGLAHYGRILTLMGEHEQARVLLCESLDISHAIHDRWAGSQAICSLGQVEYALGHFEEAKRAFAECMNEFAELSEFYGMVGAMSRLGFAELALGECTEARGHFQEALRLAKEAGLSSHMLDALVGLAHLSARDGHAELAFEVVIRVLEHPASEQITRERAEQLGVDLEARLAAQQIQAVRARAQARSLDDVIMDVLRTTG